MEGQESTDHGADKLVSAVTTEEEISAIVVGYKDALKEESSIVKAMEVPSSLTNSAAANIRHIRLRSKPNSIAAAISTHDMNVK